MPPLIEEVPDRAEESFRETYQRANNVRPYKGAAKGETHETVENIRSHQ